MVRFDDRSQLVFEVDRIDSGLVAAYLPGALDPRSDSVNYVEPDRVVPVDIGFTAVVKNCKTLGRGSREMLAGHEPQ
jgi:hypothetical protein